MPADRSLPIWQLHQSLVDSLRAENRLVLVAPTGSGKTTQVPQMLLDAGLAGGKKVVVLQPRRVAARTVAARVAQERNVPLGGEVGYQVRFDDHTSIGTRISYITEGILLRWLQDDPQLDAIGVLIFDEFHERNLQSDVALALAKQLVFGSRPDLKVVVMSATLEAEPVADYLAAVSGPPRPACPILQSEGRLFPVEIRHLADPDERPIAEQAADRIEQILLSGESGDILVFMPGMAEINATIGALRGVRLNESVAAIALHGDLPPEQQDLAFAPHPRRKIVVATNVAETSVTIPGIKFVVDSGLARVARYDAERGITTLFIEPISRASAEQRAGRAGRTGPGVCHRLWTESGHLNRAEKNTPEIQRADLAEVVLLLHSLGIRKAAAFDWLDKPDAQAVERAEALLTILGALRIATTAASDRSDLTPIGRQMLRLPLHPRYSRMLVEAAGRRCLSAAALCAALVSGRDLLMRLGRDDAHIKEARELFEASQESDFYTLMRAFEFARKNQFSVERCRRYGVHAQMARQIEQTFDQIFSVASAQLRTPSAPDPGDVAETAAEPDALPRCIMTGFIDQLCIRRDLGTLECDLTEARQGTLMRESVVQNSPLFVAASIREVPGRGSQPLTLLGLATAVKREWVEQSFPDQVTAQVEHLYDRTHRRVAAVKLVRFRDLVIHHEHQRDVDPAGSGKCLAEAALRHYFELPLFNHDLKQFLSRVNLAAEAMPELEIPGFDPAAIAESLTRAFTGLTLAKEAQTIHLKEFFVARLAPGQIAWLDELTPTSVSWPDGRKLKLLYPEEIHDEDGGLQSPELQVKINDCFALKEHPHILEGRLPVKLWLATPDGKRLESTFNWPAFRTNSYPKLRLSLQRKFPSVPWP